MQDIAEDLWRKVTPEQVVGAKVLFDKYLTK